MKAKALKNFIYHGRVQQKFADLEIKQADYGKLTARGLISAEKPKKIAEMIEYPNGLPPLDESIPAPPVPAAKKK